MFSFRPLLIFTHRYLGIAISLMCVVWFASGITMMYAGGMPQLTEQMRLERQLPLDLSRVRLTPADATQRLAVPDDAADLTNADAASQSNVAWNGGSPELLMVMQRPAYRFQDQDGGDTVFADNGEILKGIDIATARQVASRFIDVAEDRVHFDRQVNEPDQWTLTNSAQETLYKFRIDDSAGTEIYVSPRTADVYQVTTRRQRALAWMGTIPHWLYFTSLRTNQPLWYKLVVWLSALASMLAALGLCLAFTQFIRTRPFNLSKSIPYRGWMRWHYILGALFGVFALTWAFSGLMSMEPWEWTNARGLEIRDDVFTGGQPDLSRFGRIDPATFTRLLPSRTLKQIGFTRIQDEDYYVVASSENASRAAQQRERLHEPYSVNVRSEPESMLVSVRTFEVRRESFSVESIIGRLKSALPDTPIIEQRMLVDYDDYYYSRGGQRPLPVLRVKFGDPMQSWIYVDLRTSQLLSEVHRYSRIERWLYNGLHSLDFKFWYSKRPLWDIGVIALLLGGLGLSAIGLYLGVKRLIRDLLPSR